MMSEERGERSGELSLIFPGVISPFSATHNLKTPRIFFFNCGRFIADVALISFYNHCLTIYVDERNGRTHLLMEEQKHQKEKLHN